MASLHDMLQLRGTASLGDAELLALLMDDGAEGSLERAEALLDSCGGLTGVGKAELSRLRMTAGVGLKRASRLAAAAELGRRMMALESDSQAQYLSSSEEVVRYFRPRMCELKHEECWVAYLTSTNRLVESVRISQGGVQGTVVDHRLVIKRALELLAPRFILLHNHPSGTASPSDEDKHLTRRIAEAAALFDILLVDHLILTDNSYFSFRGEGLLSDRRG